MANNYTQGSSFLKIPADKLGQVEGIIKRVIAEEAEAGNDTACNYEIRHQDGGVWFKDMKCFEPEMVEKISRELVEVLELDKPFYCEWAYTCSQPHVDQFGGGAFAVVRGKNTIWINAGGDIRRMVERGQFPTD